MLAVDLHAGDTLIFSPTSSFTKPAGDKVLMKVTAGGAIAFFTDPSLTNGNKLEVQDFSGLAVTDGFDGSILSDVYGPIGTTATLSGSNLSFNFFSTGSIAGLTMVGHIHGDLYATGSISNVTILNPPGSNPADLSVNGSIEASPASVTESYDSGFSTTEIIYAVTPGANGGNITNVKLANGATAIDAGDGNPGTTGGNGGNIANVTILASPVALSLKAGGG
jgi:hypothetical protein